MLIIIAFVTIVFVAISCWNCLFIAAMICVEYLVVVIVCVDVAIIIAVVILVCGW